MLFDFKIYGDSIDSRDSAHVAAAAPARIFRQAVTVLAPEHVRIAPPPCFPNTPPCQLERCFRPRRAPARQGRRRPVSDQRSGNLQAETAAKLAQSLPKSRLSPGTPEQCISAARPNVDAILPADFTFTPADNGSAVFSGVTLVTAGTQSVTATDVGTSQLTGSGAVTIIAAPASQLSVIPPSTAYAEASPLSTAFTVTVKALDQYGNLASSYSGSVHFSSSDGSASLPSNYTFTTGSGHDNGVHVFTSGVNMVTAGSQDLIVTDTADSSVAGSAPVSVSQPTFKFSAAEYAVNESTSTVTITVQYTGPSNSSTATVHYATSDGSAINGSGHDYASASGTLTFAASTNSATFTVTIHDPTLSSGSKYFTVSLSSPSSPFIIYPDFGTAEVIINDNDTGAFSLSDDPSASLMVPVGEAEVDPNLGAVQISQPLDFDISPGAGVAGKSRGWSKCCQRGQPADYSSGFAGHANGAAH